jgi:hypothetical protein
MIDVLKFQNTKTRRFVNLCACFSYVSDDLASFDDIDLQFSSAQHIMRMFWNFKTHTHKDLSICVDVNLGGAIWVVGKCVWIGDVEGIKSR